MKAGPSHTPDPRLNNPEVDRAHLNSLVSLSFPGPVRGFRWILRHWTKPAVMTDTSAVGSDSIMLSDEYQNRIKTAYDCVNLAISRFRCPAGFLATAFRDFSKVAHMTAPGATPPMTAEGVYPTTPSKGSLLEWRSYFFHNPDVRAAFDEVWRHCHPKSEPYTLSRSYREASNRQDAFIEARYSERAEVYPHDFVYGYDLERIQFSDPPGLSYAFQYPAEMPKPTFRPSDEPRLLSVLEDPSHEAELRSSAETVLRLSTDDELQRLLPQSRMREWGLPSLRQYLPLAHKHTRGTPVAALESDPSDRRVLKTGLAALTLQNIVLDLGPPAVGTEEEKLAQAATLVYEHLTGTPIWGTYGNLKPYNWVSKAESVRRDKETRPAVQDSLSAGDRSTPLKRRIRKVRDLPRFILGQPSPLDASQQAHLGGVESTVRDFISRNGLEKDGNASQVLKYLEFAHHHLPGEPIWDIDGAKISPEFSGGYEVRNILSYDGRTRADTAALVSLFHHVEGDSAQVWGPYDRLKPLNWTEDSQG